MDAVEARQKPRDIWKREQLPDGQFSTYLPLPPPYTAEFIEQLKELRPWENHGAPLKEYDPGTDRRIEKFVINDIPFVLKEYRMSGNELLETLGDGFHHRKKVFAFTPTAQILLVNKARQRYTEKYNEELFAELPFAFFIDQNTTKKYGFFPYYEQKEVDIDDVGMALDKLDFRLRKIGVNRAEELNYITTTDPNNPKSFRIVLIDTEYWQVENVNV